LVEYSTTIPHVHPFDAMAKEITANWSDAEKVHLLLEIMKDKNVVPELLDIIKNKAVVPEWKSVKLPQGRTLASAQTEYLSLTRSFPTRRPPLEDNDDDDEDDDEEMEDADSNSVASGPALKKQRREKSSSEDDGSGASTSGADSSNGSENGTTSVPARQTALSMSTTATGQTGTVPFKRKRGRPTKAETEARKAAIARGELPPPKPPSYTPVSTPVYTIGADGIQRRRRGRPSKAEIAARKAAEAAGTLPPTPSKKAGIKAD